MVGSGRTGLDKRSDALQHCSPKQKNGYAEWTAGINIGRWDAINNRLQTLSPRNLERKLEMICFEENKNRRKQVCDTIYEVVRCFFCLVIYSSSIKNKKNTYSKFV